MMRAVFCAAALALVGVPDYAWTTPPYSSVTIAYRFDGAPSNFVLQEMSDEVRRLMEPSSMYPEWRERAQVSSSASFSHLVVVDFRGQCRSAHLDSTQELDQPLGRARVVDGEVFPFVEIDCDRVQAFLRSTSWGRQNQNSDPALGRALGRVLAHELYHVLSGTMSHSQTGVARSSLSAFDLTSGRLSFTRDDINRMVSRRENVAEVRVAHRGPSFVQ
jgi:hypothetical protein